MTERAKLTMAEAEIDRLKETIRAFGRGDIVPITDKDAEIERLRAALAWIDNTDPEMVAAAEEKFGFKLVVEQQVTDADPA